MKVLDKIASALNRRDEEPNQELAKEIVETTNTEAVEELVENLTNKSKAIQNDCIKVLYEIGEHQPAMIAEHMEIFLALLNSKNNRLQWGAMTALNCISTVKPKDIYGNLTQIIDAAGHGSVITRDHAVNILINLASTPEYSENAFNLLLEQLLKSPANQLPMYVERALPVVKEEKKEGFITALRSRLDDMEKESKRKRIEKVIKKLTR